MNALRRLLPRPDAYIGSSKRVDVRVMQHVLPLPNVPDGLTALFVSDVHLCPGMDADRLAAQMAAQQADLILLGGDFSDTREESLRLFRAFRALRAPLGIFAVCGNNDAEAFPTNEELADALASFGAQLLVGRSVRLDCGLWIGGMDESKHHTPDCTGLFPADADGCKILLSHFPLKRTLEAVRPDLMLSGHTHGGQFNCLGLTPYILGYEFVSGLGPALVSGIAQFGPTTLLVSKGIGGSKIPLRVGVRPEIHRLTFCAGRNC